MALAARYGGTCGKCTKRYPPATMIERQAKTGAWSHVDCPVAGPVPVDLCPYCELDLLDDDLPKVRTYRGWAHVSCDEQDRAFRAEQRAAKPQVGIFALADQFDAQMTKRP